MAAALRLVTAVLRRTRTGQSHGSTSRTSGATLILSRTAVCTSSGAVLPKPRRDLCSSHLIQEQQELVQTPFGLMRISLVVVPFLYVGTLISKNFAALLEEHDIFVPEDDDDDD